jgi:hypothetical protein
MSIPTFFNRIIKEVTDGVKVDFSTEQLSEAHLQKLATLWEQKLLALDSVRTDPIAGEAEISEQRKQKSQTEEYEIAQHGENIRNTHTVSGDSSDSDDNSNGDVAELQDDISNLVLAQFEKVTRSKSKWKCVLKEGMMNINGIDYTFSKATGELHW